MRAAGGGGRWIINGQRQQLKMSAELEQLRFDGNVAMSRGGTRPATIDVGYGGAIFLQVDDSQS